MGGAGGTNGAAAGARRAGSAALVALSLLVTMMTGAAGSVAEPVRAGCGGQVDHYVALGDSYTSGPLIPFVRPHPLPCLRSTNNYPSLLAAELDPETFVDASCAGADTTHMTTPQGSPLPYNPPQFDALSENTDLVTLGIGGNDSDVFGDMIDICPDLHSVDPTGAPCREYFALPGGGDELLARIAVTERRIVEVVHEIRGRSPRARVLLVGYPRLVPESGYCPDRLPLADGDYDYADEIEQALNDALADAAEATGATYVDTYGPSRGHDICATGGAAWINGARFSLFAAPYHPFASGMAGVAALVLDAVRGAQPDRAAAERAAARARAEVREAVRHDPTGRHRLVERSTAAECEARSVSFCRAN